MKKVSLLSLLLCITLLVAPTLAQDKGQAPLMATFSDETGLFSVQYPAELIVVGRGVTEGNGLTVPNVFLVSSPALLTRVLTEKTPPFSPLQKDDWGIAILFFPKAMFAQMGVAADAPISDVAKAWAKMFLTDPDNTTTFQTNPVKLISGVETTVIVGRASDDGAGGPPPEDNYLMLHEIADGVIALTTIVSAVDGRTDDMVAKHLAVTNSLKFTGKAEDILAMMTPPSQ